MYDPKLYYGNGNCEVDATEAWACIVEVKYPLEIEDVSPYEYCLQIVNSNIIVFKFREGNAKLKELFKYQGDMVVVRSHVVAVDGIQATCSLNKVMDYSELLGKAEDITTNSEHLSGGSRYGKQVDKMKLINPIIPDLKTIEGQYFLENGAPYNGMHHVHQDTGHRMSGSDHTKDSQYLYFKEEVGGKLVDKLILATFENYKNSKLFRK